MGQLWLLPYFASLTSVETVYCDRQRIPLSVVKYKVITKIILMVSLCIHNPHTFPVLWSTAKWFKSVSSFMRSVIFVFPTDSTLIMYTLKNNSMIITNMILFLNLSIASDSGFEFYWWFTTLKQLLQIHTQIHHTFSIWILLIFRFVRDQILEQFWL